MKSRIDGNISAIKTGFGLGLFQFITFGSFVYGLSIGGVFVHDKISKGSNYYVAGDVISVFFGILFGIQALGLAAPFIK